MTEELREEADKKVVKTCYASKITLFIIIKIMLGLIISVGYLIIKTEKISKNLVPMCDKGYCLSVELPTKNNYWGFRVEIRFLTERAKKLSLIGIQTLIIDNLYEYKKTDKFNEEDYKLLVKSLKKYGIGLFTVLPTDLELSMLEELINMGVHGFILDIGNMID